MLTIAQRKIAIFSSDADFSAQISGRWQSERVVPAFTVMSREDSTADPDAFDLAIVDISSADSHRVQRRSLETIGKPVIFACRTADILQSVRRESPRATALARQEGWADFVVLLAVETLRRVDAAHRADRAEHVNALLKCHATLGQYMIEMRHSLNNALTSVLGNSDLLLLEPGAFSAGVRAQIDTIRNMSLRMHEILQRFSSLEKELTFVEQQAVKELNRNLQLAAVNQ